MKTVPPENYDPPEPERFTDVGNARRLVALHGAELRYVPSWGTWLVWDGRRFERDHRCAVTEKAKSVARALVREALAEPDPDRRKTAVRWAMQSEGAGRIRAMIELARSHPGVPVMPDELDHNPWLLNVENGTLDLRASVLRPHDPADLLTKLAPVAFDSGAECPQWMTFLGQILPDADVRAFLQETVGYCLTGRTTEQKLFFAYGSGANGKSVLQRVLLSLLGEYGRQSEPDLLLSRDSAHPTGVADLQGARLVLSSEIEEGRRLAEATVKQLTGSDRVKARLMHQDFFEFEPTHKLFIAANHRPIIRGTDHAIWRRLRLIPFTVTIPDSEQDRGLAERLEAELPGILRWAVDGCRRWQQDGMSEPDAVRMATAEYREEMDLLGGFLSEKCVAMEVATASAHDLYRAYTDWCDENGERAVTQRRFGMSLTERGFDRQRMGASMRWHWLGIGLLTGQTDPTDPTDPDSVLQSPMCAYVREPQSKGRKGLLGLSEQENLPFKDSE